MGRRGGAFFKSKSTNAQTEIKKFVTFALRPWFFPEAFIEKPQTEIKNSLPFLQTFFVFAPNGGVCFSKNKNLAR